MCIVQFCHISEISSDGEIKDEQNKGMLFLRHLGIGGIESFLNNVYTNLDLSDFIVDIVAANQFESVFTEPLKKLGIHFYELSGRQNNFKENVKAFESILKKETMM